MGRLLLQVVEGGPSHVPLSMPDLAVGVSYRGCIRSAGQCNTRPKLHSPLLLTHLRAPAFTNWRDAVDCAGSVHGTAVDTASGHA